MDQSLLPNIYDFITHTYPFSQLRPLECDAAATAIKISYHSPDDELKDEQIAGAGLYMIRAGVAEEINKDDNSLRCRLGVGDSFGYTQIDKEGQSDYKVTFLENTLLYFIPKQVLQFLIEKNKAVGNYFNSKEWIRLRSSHQYADESDDGITPNNAKKIISVCQRDFATVTPDTTIQTTAQIMAHKHVDIVTVVDENEMPTGVVTKSDMAVRCVAAGLDIRSPVSKIMTNSVFTVNASSPLFEAMEQMVIHRIRNLPVIQDGKIVGTLTTTELMKNTHLQAIYLVQSISSADDLDSLCKLSVQNKEIFRTLVQNNMQPHSIQRVLSHIADEFCSRIAELGEQKFGKAPCHYAFVAAGSLARNEVQFLSDQDNAIITERELATDEERAYFKTLAEFICTSLDKCGYPLCDGNYMASNPKWCASYDTWKKYYSSWIANTDKEALLNSQVFLDMRLLYGDEFLLNKLKNHLISLISENSRFLATLTTISTTVSPPLGMFKQFVLTKDGKNNPSLNIKKQAVNLIVELGRIYGLSAKCLSSDTYRRLESAADAGLLNEDDLRELTEAYTFLNSVRFDHQLQAMNEGRKMTNNLEPSKLSQFERNHLRDAFRIIARHQQAATFRFAGG